MWWRRFKLHFLHGKTIASPKKQVVNRMLATYNHHRGLAFVETVPGVRAGRHANTEITTPKNPTTMHVRTSSSQSLQLWWSSRHCSSLRQSSLHQSWLISTILLYSQETAHAHSVISYKIYGSIYIARRWVWNLLASVVFCLWWYCFTQCQQGQDTELRIRSTKPLNVSACHCILSKQYVNYRTLGL